MSPPTRNYRVTVTRSQFLSRSIRGRGWFFVYHIQQTRAYTYIYTHTKGVGKQKKSRAFENASLFRSVFIGRRSSLEGERKGGSGFASLRPLSSEILRTQTSFYDRSFNSQRTYEFSPRVSAIRKLEKARIELQRQGSQRTNGIRKIFLRINAPVCG